MIFSSTSSKCLERLKRYIMDVWNILDILVIICYFIGLSMKMYSEFFPAKVMFSCALLLSYFRLLQMLSITKSIGPKLTMISMLVISFPHFQWKIWIITVRYKRCRNKNDKTPLSVFIIFSTFSSSFLPLWTDMSRKYLGKDKSVFRGMVQDSIYDVTM